MSGTVELDVLAVLLLLFLSFTASYLLRKYKIVWFPESAAASMIPIIPILDPIHHTDILYKVIFGFIFAVIWHFIPSLKDFSFSVDLFFFVLLPAIIFECGFSVHRQRFFKNFGAILTFAIPGTLITAFAIGALFYLFSRLKGGYDDLVFLDFLIFGSIISATDPVATLSIFSKVTVNPNLYSLVFGESVLNDAAAITLFRTLAMFFDKDLTTKLAFAAVGKFILIFVGSAFIGVLVGAICSFIMKRTNINHEPHLEILLIVGCGYFAYFLCDVITLSGIVSIFFVGVSIRHYAWYCLSETSQNGSPWFFNAFKEGSETSIFCLLGFSIFYNERYDVFLIGVGIAVCIIGRAFAVFPLSNILNLFRSRSSRISCKWQLIIFNSGLKGAVAVGLSLSKEMANRPEWGVMITAIHCTVIFSILFHGILTSPLLSCTQRFEIPREDRGTVRNPKVHSLWSRFDKRFIIPLVSKPRSHPDEDDYSQIPDETTHHEEEGNLESEGVQVDNFSQSIEGEDKMV